MEEILMPPVTTRLVWDGQSCLVLHEGVRVEFPTLPCVPGLCRSVGHTTDRYHCLHIVRLAYVPAARVHEIRESAGHRREMTASEVTAVHAWMTLLVSDIRAAAYRLAAGG
jgi:hypothetical protein